MTEVEWLKSTDLDAMLALLPGGTSERKLRLFACDCCRQYWSLFKGASREAVEVSESYADGKATPRQLATAARKARCKHEELQSEAVLAINLASTLLVAGW
jgi:hypothetical protein